MFCLQVLHTDIYYILKTSFANKMYSDRLLCSIIYYLDCPSLRVNVYDLLELKSLGKIEKAYQAFAFRYQFPTIFQNLPLSTYYLLHTSRQFLSYVRF